VNVADGQTIKGDIIYDTESWSDTWVYKTEGDDRALPDSYDTSEDSFPSKSRQVQNSVNDITRNIEYAVNNFIRAEVSDYKISTER
jgi:hypothetical protein